MAKKTTGTTAKRAVAKQREIQRGIDAKPAKKKEAKPPKKKAVQAGRHREPEPPMPAQHLAKPGMEHELSLAPRWQAPDYNGSGKLEDMVAIVTGGDSGIGRAVAVLFAREGADVAVLHLAEERDARDTVAAIEREG